MSIAPEERTAAPEVPPRRDVLGHAFYWFHLAITFFIVGGWAIPSRAVLVFYAVFLPGVALHWQLNRNACVLNNLESWLRTGRWRDPHNREEGQWLLGVVKDVTGIVFTPAQMDALTYVAVAALWGVALWRIFA